MKEYLAVNRSKFLFQFIVTSITCSIIWTIIVITDKGEINFDTKLFGYLFFAFPLSIFTQIFLQTGEAIEFIRINKILNNSQFNQLINLGFTKSLSGKKDKWLSSKPMLIGSIDGYPFKIGVEKGIVRVIAQANLDLVEKTNMEQLKSIFGKNNVEYDVGIALLYRSSRRKNITFKDIHSELKQFISFLKLNKIDAWEE